jgi:DNA-binding beta-propeller fold protein YncE
MKRILIGISLLLMVVATANLAQQNTGTPQPSQTSGGVPPANPLKVALLHWYRANTTTRFTVGSQPYGLAFDGANIWTGNFGDGTVTKVRANDGEVLGTFGVGVEPYGVTFDGANIWVSNVGSGTVTKLRASDGKNLGTFTVGAHPGWMAFDGANIWVPSGQNI